MLEQEQETVKLRVRVLKANNQNVALRVLVSEARCFVELLQHHPLTACWAHEWLQRANEQLEEEAPR